MLKALLGKLTGNKDASVKITINGVRELDTTIENIAKHGRMGVTSHLQTIIDQAIMYAHPHIDYFKKEGDTLQITATRLPDGNYRIDITC